MRIVEVVQDPRSTAHDLHKIVSNDPQKPIYDVYMVIDCNC